MVVPFDYDAAAEKRQRMSHPPSKDSARGGEGGSGSRGRGRKSSEASRGRGRGRGGREVQEGRSANLLGSSPYDASGGIKMMRGGKRNALTPASGNRTSTFK